MTPTVAGGITLGRPQSLEGLRRVFGGQLDEGLSSRSVSRITPPLGPGEAVDLVVVTQHRYVEAAGESRGILLCDPVVAPRLTRGNRWVHELPWWVVAELVRDVPAPEVMRGPCHVARTASVSPSAVIGTGAIVHEGAVVGDETVLGEYSVLYRGVRIGKRVEVGAHAVLGRPGFGFANGPGDTSFRIPHLGGVVVEDDAHIGAHCTVDAGTLEPTRVGRGARLDAHVHVAHNVVVGDGTFVAAQTGFAGSVVVGRGVLFGGQSGVADHVRIGDGARVAAKSGVIGDVPAGATVAGFPAVSRVRWLRSMAFLLRRGSGNGR